MASHFFKTIVCTLLLFACATSEDIELHQAMHLYKEKLNSCLRILESAGPSYIGDINWLNVGFTYFLILYTEITIVYIPL